MEKDITQEKKKCPYFGLNRNKFIIVLFLIVMFSFVAYIVIAKNPTLNSYFSDKDADTIYKSMDNSLSINPSQVYYTGKYKVIKTGNETNLDVIQNTIGDITYIKVTADKPNYTIIANIKGVDKEVGVWIVPDKLGVSKSNKIIFEKNINKTLVKKNPLSITPTKFETGDTYVYETELNPKSNVNDRYVKIGNNSIYLIAETDVYTNGIANGTRVEANFTHASLNDSSLVLYYPFDYNINGTEFDYSINNNDGIYSRTNQYATGVYGNASLFSGTIASSPVIIDSQSLNNINSAFAIALWVNEYGSPDGQAKYVLNKAGCFNLRFANLSGQYRLTLNVVGLSDEFINYLDAVNQDTAAHFVVMYNTTDLVIYKNGVYIYSEPSTGTVTNTTDNLYVGANAVDTGDFNGWIDDFMIYNRSLSSTEISNIYNNQSARFVNNGIFTTPSLNITAGDNRVNISVGGVQNYQSTNLSARIISWSSGGGYSYSSYQNITSKNNYSFNFESTATNISVEFKFDTNPYSFYSPIVAGNINFNTWLEQEAVALNINFTNPTPANGTTTTNTSIIVNISVSGNAQNIIYNWNGTNYTCNIKSYFGNGTYSCTDYNNASIILAYNFDNITSIGDNSTEVVDVSKNNAYNGTINGDTTYVNGKYNKALTFDGTGDWVTTAYNIDFDDALTISLWVNLTDVAANSYTMAGAGVPTTWADYWMLLPRADKSGVVLQYQWNGRGGATFTTPSKNIAAGTWHHIVLTKASGTNIKIYQDGVKITDENMDGSGYSPVLLSFGGILSSNYLNGMIDDVRVYNSLINQNEVNNIYNTNLYKYSTNYNLVVNQTGLSKGTYYYQGYVNDTSNNFNQTEVRWLNIIQSRVGLSMLNPILPASQVNVSKSLFFNVTINVSCDDADCGDINVSLDPNPTCTGSLVVADCSSGAVYPNCGDYYDLSDNNPFGYCFAFFGSGVYCQCADVGGYCDENFFGNPVCDPPTGGGSKSGLINTTAGATPFYTNSTTNPITVNLNASQSTIVTFWVNATGELGTNHTFFAFANITSNMALSNITGKWNVTIIEGAAPSDSCTYTTGNWDILCSDNCNVATTTNLAGNNISIRGAGSLRGFRNIINYKYGWITGGCNVWN